MTFGLFIKAVLRLPLIILGMVIMSITLMLIILLIYPGAATNFKDILFGISALLGAGTVGASLKNKGDKNQPD